MSGPGALPDAFWEGTPPTTYDRAFDLEADKRQAALLADDADRFSMPLDRVVHLVRLLTFSGSHPHISDQRPLSPEEIADVILHGVLRRSDAPPVSEGDRS